MGSRCTICSHADRLDIDRGIIAGLPYRDIAGRFAVSKSAIERHASDHISKLISRARDLRDWLNADQLVGELRVLREVVLGILEEARADGDHATALQAIGRLEKQAELVARLLGELVEHQRVQMVDASASEQWSKLLPIILSVLEPYPDARRALVEALSDVGS